MDQSSFMKKKLPLPHRQKYNRTLEDKRIIILGGYSKRNL